MKRNITLSRYVQRRNGVPLGHRQSLPNNLQRAFGAGSSAQFWQHWNPIWSYYLWRYIYSPANRWLPRSIAVIIAFAVSGALHDLAIGLVGKGWQSFFTLWFVVMGLFLLQTEYFKLSYKHLPWSLRASINMLSIALCFVVTWQIRNFAESAT